MTSALRLEDHRVSRKRGRKTRVEEQASTCTVTIKVTPEERQRLRQLTERAGVTLSAYCRACILDTPIMARPVIPPVNLETYTALAPLASNFNQMTKHLNQNNLTGRVSAIAPDDLRTTVEDIGRILKNLRLELVGES